MKFSFNFHPYWIGLGFAMNTDGMQFDFIIISFEIDWNKKGE